VGKVNTDVSGSKGEGGYHRILFVNPKSKVGPGDLAEKLVNLRLFEDIFVENHKKGYVARVKFFPGCEPKRPDKYISRNVGKEFGLIIKIQ
jgi:hypothetical protein